VAAVCSVAHGRMAGLRDTPSGPGDLVWFRQQFYACLTARAEALFELTEAVLCADGPVTSLVALTLVAEHRRGHGAMYDALNAGRVEPARLRRALASLPLPRAADGRIVLAVEVSPWLRPDAPTSGERLFCHVYGRAHNNAQLIPAGPTPSSPPSNPVEFQNPAMVSDLRFSGRCLVLVDQAAEDRSTPDPAVDRLGESRWRARRAELQRSMRPLGVVVRFIRGKHPAQVSLPEDHGRTAGRTPRPARRSEQPQQRSTDGFQDQSAGFMNHQG
jgi:hypothetical protein